MFKPVTTTWLMQMLNGGSVRYTEGICVYACLCVCAVCILCAIMLHSFLSFYVHIFTLQVIELENRCRRSAEAKILIFLFSGFIHGCIHQSFLLSSSSLLGF
ncbi:unnamed protein product [Prunus brigantina]